MTDSKIDLEALRKASVDAATALANRAEVEDAVDDAQDRAIEESVARDKQQDERLDVLEASRAEGQTVNITGTICRRVEE